jgi:hypothetical protein
MTTQDLPPQVLAALRRLGEDFHRQGVEVFLFGSFARGEARSNSDLDLAFGFLQAPEARLESDLYSALDELPTIRPIDLVDLRYAAEGLVNAVNASGIPLTRLGPA